MSNVLIILVACVAGVFIFYKMIRKSLETQSKSGLVITGIIMVLVTMIAMTVANKPGHKRASTQSTVAQSEPQELTAQDLENKRKAKEQYEAERARSEQMLAENKSQADERRRQQEEERAASRMTIEDFDWRLMENVNAFVDAVGLNHVDHMGTPERHAEGVDETLTYPLDLEGDLSITEVTKDGKIKGARIIVHRMNQGSMLSAVVFYNALVQVFVTSGEANSIFYGLHLDETFFDDGKNTRTVNHKGYRYEKKFPGSTLVLSVAEQ